MKRLLIVGAGGFIGGFICKRALELGYDTTAGIRPSTSRQYLEDPRLKFLEFDYSSAESIAATLAASGQSWDYVIYNLGATKCTNFRDFNRINFECLRNFGTALRQCGIQPEKFLYVSSLSALGPGDEKDYAPLTEKMLPNPNTKYGLSKIKAEQWLETLSGLNWIIFRPTGVYGPHEKDYLMMIQSIDKHFDFGVGYRKQMLTFIYVEDLVDAMFKALEKAPINRKYNISEPAAYTQAEFRKIVAELLGRKFVVPVRLPLWAVKGVSVVAEKIGAITGKPSTLNSDKYQIMKQRNWNCTTSAAEEDFGFRAAIPLREGLRKTIAAYRGSRED